MNRIILHPFLVPLFPVFALYLNNLTTLPPATLARPLAVLELISLLAWAGLSRLFRNTRAAAVMVSLLMFIFFLNRNWGTWEMLAAWLFIAITLTLEGKQNPSRLAKVSAPLNVVVLTLLLLQAGRYLQSVRHAAFEAGQAAIVTARQPDKESLPNIVHIILDGFGRPDLVKKEFGCDVGFLVDFLNTNGFAVAGHARANYFQTMQSVASTLSMNYLPGSATDATSTPPLSRPQLSRVVAASAVKRELARLGYRVEGAIATAYLLSQWNTPEKNKALFNLTEDLLVRKSCLYPLVQRYKKTHKTAPPPSQETVLRAHYARVRTGFESGAESVRRRTPVYQMLHIVSPHPPFIFNADGSYRDPGAADAFIFSDGNHFVQPDDTWSTYRAGYSGQIRWVAAETCRLVERILRESSRPVVIIIQGDHGPGLRFNWFTSACDLGSRSGILLAIRLPDKKTGLPEGFQSPVNIYRHLFRELWGADLPLLPTRVIYSTWGKPDVFEDVTAQVKDDPL
jgi:hypothetical protein